MRPAIVILTLATVAWLAVGWLLGMAFLRPVSDWVLLAWLVPPMVMAFSAVHLFQRLERRWKAEERVKELRRRAHSNGATGIPTAMLEERRR